MLVLRRKRPIRVTRGSLLRRKSGQGTSLRWRSSSLSSSALETMVRNFNRSNRRPARPVRGCRKKTPPAESSSLIARATTSIGIPRTSSATVAVALLVLGIPMLVVALAIKLDDSAGGVFFRQPRTGLAGRRFDLLKFRTMVSNADELKDELRHLSEVPWPDFRLSNDPRVTRIGRFLRKTSMDELPQLINVLKGDMTLVGPRPTSFEASTYATWQTGRLDFRPGLTGPGP